MSQRRLKEEEHTVRDIKPSMVIDYGDELSCFPQAFRLRLKGESEPPRSDDEKYLSALWREFFDGTFDEILRQCVTTLRQGRSLRPAAALVVCNVGQLEQCGVSVGAKIRVWHSPKSWNKAYAAIRGMKPKHQENDDLGTLFVEHAVTSVHRVRDIR